MLLTNQFLVVACLLGSALAATRRYNLTLTNEVVQPDGFKRTGIVVNRKIPGTLITANKGDRLQVNIINKLTDITMPQGTSIHWHGILQRRTADQDGTAWVTQCPIAANDTFMYDFPLGDQTGTYWYHSHVTTQYCDGLRGPLVIYDRADPHRSLYDIDDATTVITLGDWLHLPSPQGWRDFENPQSTLINGLGRLPGKKTALSVINVNFARRYRFRVINTACISSFNFSIDSHKLQVIEADGVETKPVTVDVVPIYAGQRYSIVVHANQKIGNYWMRARPEFVGGTASTEAGVDAAILRYKGAKAVDPTTQKSGNVELKEQSLVPLKASTLSHQKPDVNITLIIGSKDHDFTINGQTFAPPPIPVLLGILSGNLQAGSAMPNSVIELPRNKLIAVTIPGGLVNAPHPFHLHGHTFEVVRSAGSNVTNTRNPPIRDVVNTGLTGDDVTIYFRTDNPGPWIFHCHIDYHLEAGLAVVFAEAIADQVKGPSAIDPPTPWDQLCPKWNALKTGKQYSVTDKLPQPE
ncbi:laccase [Collybia nuda]|uniref:laccase n=1 Tax=Collybia nuda TaxID=64659 RepID=A0A9P6CDD6_9AGAR|nr:laccase [Collybia nuda]